MYLISRHIYIYTHLLRTRADADTHRHTFNEFPVHKQIIFIGWIPIVGSCFPTFPISKMFLHCVHGPSGTMIGQLSSLEDHPNLVGPLVIITHIHTHTHICIHCMPPIPTNSHKTSFLDIQGTFHNWSKENMLLSITVYGRGPSDRPSSIFSDFLVLFLVG